MKRGDIFRIDEPILDEGYVITRDEGLFPIYGVCLEVFDDDSLTTKMYVPDLGGNKPAEYHWDWMPEHQEKMEVIDV